MLFQKGHSISEKLKKKLSQAMKKYYQTHPHPRGMLGKRLSEEQKKKSSEIRKKNLKEVKKLVAMNKKRGGKTYEEIYGIERAKEIRLNQSKAQKGRTYDDIFGIEKAIKQKEKLRKSHIGHKASNETKLKMRESAQIGEKNFNWKGGITSLREKIRKLPEYKEWRDSIYKNDDYTCQECGARSEKNKRVYIEAHHNEKSFSKLFAEFLKEYNQFSPFEDIDTLLRLAINWQPFWNAEGVTLCKDCHKLTKNYLFRGKT